MYWAVSQLRDANRDFLDEAPLSDEKRSHAIEVDKTCNHLIRYFRDQFSQNGVDIQSMLPWL